MLRMSLDVIPYGGLSMHFLRDSFFLEDYITEGCYAEERFPNCRSLIVLAFPFGITASAKDAEPAKVEIDFSNVEERKIEFEVGGGKKNDMACYGSIICHLRRSDSSIGKVWY